ncbi:hypothetical protein CBR_g11119 [Chara braunii]|uniref:Uncharacterized protein n=1 Tax=Chara braunii TaxID=69332 RepID=A0A388KQ65_CHABU|nr:hypothetical protein CBR_g11119 [Chara braunii]|eukprot:GBG72186.1 hypothetical protein CBR_g11119 [Chara braunii]
MRQQRFLSVCRKLKIAAYSSACLLCIVDLKVENGGTGCSAAATGRSGDEGRRARTIYLRPAATRGRSGDEGRRARTIYLRPYYSSDCCSSEEGATGKTAAGAGPACRMEQLAKVLTDDRCSKVNKNLAEWALLEHKATNSYFTNWDDRIGRLERKVDDVAAQQSKILNAIQDLTAQLTAAKLIAPQPPALSAKPKPSPSLSSTPSGSRHSSPSPSPSQKASAKPTFAAIVRGDQRGPKIPAPNKFRGDDPKIDVGDWAAGTRAYLRGFICPEQIKVATILGLLEGPAQKWATSTSNGLQKTMEDWALGLGVDSLLQALEDRFADKERARKAADKIARLGQQRYSGSLQSLFVEFEQLTSTPGLVMFVDDLLTNFCRAAPEKFSVALYSAGHKDWRSFGCAALDMEAKLHVQAPSSDRRKGAFPRGGRKGKAAFAHAGAASASDSDSQADTPSAGTGSAAETDIAAALTQAVLGVLQQ